MDFPHSLPGLALQVGIAVAITGWLQLRKRLARSVPEATVPEAPDARAAEFEVVFLETGHSGGRLMDDHKRVSLFLPAAVAHTTE